MSIEEVSAPASAPGSSVVHFNGRAGEVIPIAVKNALLNIVTLGFYRFWGRTKVRRYLWEKLHVFDTPLEYTGTGKELFAGFLFIVFLVFLPYAALNAGLAATGLLENPSFVTIYNALIVISAYYLIGVASYRARRYRLSRTRWRSVRAGQTGSGWSYGLWYIFLGALMVFFGLITPYKNMKLWRIRMQNTHVGDKFFVFDRDGEAGATLKKLYLSFFLFGLTLVAVYALPLIAAGLFLDFGSTLTAAEIEVQIERQMTASPWMAIAFVLIWTLAFFGFFVGLVWYKLRETRLLVALTTFENLKLKFSAGVGSYFLLVLGNLLIVFATLGFGLPFVQMRFARYFAAHTEIDGALDLAAIAQSADDDLTSGEGLAEAFDMGSI